MALDVSRVTIATVADGRAPYITEVGYLFASLELFGGALRAARRRAYVIDGVSGETHAELRDLGVDVRVVPEVEPRFRLANKLAMLVGEAADDTDILVALDSDTVVAGDFTEYLDPEVVQAKQPDGDLLPLDVWRRLFHHFGLVLPRERHPTSLYPGWTHAYFNTGVIIVPGVILRPLHDRWLHYVRAVIHAAPSVRGLMDRLGDRVPQYEGAISEDLRHLFYAEQWAFSLALQDLGAPYAVLPLSVNFPTIYNRDQRPGAYVRERFLPHHIAPLVIHHHHDVEQGLRRTGYARPDEVIERVNAALFRRSPALP